LLRLRPSLLRLRPSLPNWKKRIASCGTRSPVGLLPGTSKVLLLFLLGLAQLLAGTPKVWLLLLFPLGLAQLLARTLTRVLRQQPQTLFLRRSRQVLLRELMLRVLVVWMVATIM
jgi:hypothetical protein